jgi:hypothetical protein
MPRPLGAATFTEVSHTAYAQPDLTGTAGFAIILLRACPYASNRQLMQQPCQCFVGFCGIPSHFQLSFSNSITTI